MIIFVSLDLEFGQYYIVTQYCHNVGTCTTEAPRIRESLSQEKTVFSWLFSDPAVLAS